MSDDLIERLEWHIHACPPGAEKAYHADIAWAVREIARLRSENGSLKHKAAVAQIGHDQHNRFIRLLIAAGAQKSMSLDAQVEWVCAKLAEVEAERDGWAKIVGSIASAVPLPVTLKVTGKTGDMIAYFTGLSARAEAAEARLAEAERIIEGLLLDSFSQKHRRRADARKFMEQSR